MPQTSEESTSVFYQIKELNRRFERVESHLDEVRLAIVQMARTEERVSMVLEQNTELFRKLNALQKQVGQLEKENATQGQSLGFFERLSWIVTTALVGLGVWFVKQ